MRKYNRQISHNTLKLLLARSGNQCAFPNCSHPIFDDNSLFIAQICHIEGVLPLSQRHNSAKSDEETNAYENLLFLCYRHHKETDNVDLYPVKKLKEIKAYHEAKYKEATYQYSSATFNELVKETNAYWQQVDMLHANHISPEQAVPINSNSDIITLISEINENLRLLNEISIVLMDEFKATHFECVCLFFPNFLTRICISLDQIEIKYNEELLLRNPDNKNLKSKLKLLRKNFEKIAQSAGLAD